MTEIRVQRASRKGNNFAFKVNVKEGNTQTEHMVEMSPDYYNSLSDGEITMEQIVEGSFRFLLDREPKESILRRFNLSQIALYFPEYEKAIKNYF